MNHFFKTLSLAALALASSLALATEPGAWDKFKAAAHTSKNEAVAEAKKMIAATDKQIEEMKKEAAKSAGDTKKAHQENMKELQAKRKAAAEHLAKLEKSAATTWDATKEGFSNAYAEMQKSFEKAKASAAAK